MNTEKTEPSGTQDKPQLELRRRIPLAQPLIEIFTQLMKYQDGKKDHRQTTTRKQPRETRPFFPFTRMTAFRIIRTASVRTGIRTQDGRLVHPHALRHSFAIHWIKSGGNLEMLQRYLGHADSKTTSIYLQFAPTDLMHEQDRIFTTQEK